MGLNCGRVSHSVSVTMYTNNYIDYKYVNEGFHVKSFYLIKMRY